MNSHFCNEDVYSVIGHRLAQLLLNQNSDTDTKSETRNLFLDIGQNISSGDYSVLQRYNNKYFLHDRNVFLQSSSSNTNNERSSCNTPENHLLFDYEEDDNLAAAFRPRPPPEDYVCHFCYQPGHYIKYCPKAMIPNSYGKTPYQGPLQSEGDFYCNKCKRHWTSRRSFANVGQKCRKCHVIVYPKKQRKRIDSVASSLNSLELTPSVSPSLISSDNMPGYCYGSALRNIQF